MDGKLHSVSILCFAWSRYCENVFCVLSVCMYSKQWRPRTQCIVMRILLWHIVWYFPSNFIHAHLCAYTHTNRNTFYLYSKNRLHAHLLFSLSFSHSHSQHNVFGIMHIWYSQDVLHAKTHCARKCFIANVKIEWSTELWLFQWNLQNQICHSHIRFSLFLSSSFPLFAVSFSFYDWFCKRVKQIKSEFR